jgi:hypothetical protein
MIERLVPAVLPVKALLPDKTQRDPVTAGTMAALAMDVATCELATTQNSCEIKIRAEAVTTAMPGTITQARL